MVLQQQQSELCSNRLTGINTASSSQKRRIRRKKLQSKTKQETPDCHEHSPKKLPGLVAEIPDSVDTGIGIPDLGDEKKHSSLINNNKDPDKRPDMSSKESDKTKEEIKAAREAKKLAKQKAKNKDSANSSLAKEISNENLPKQGPVKDPKPVSKDQKCVDEVDRAAVKEAELGKSTVPEENQSSKDQVLAERAAKKAAKQAKKKAAGGDIEPNPEMTVKDVVETLKDIKNVAKDVQDLTAKVSAIHFEAKKHGESSKSNVVEHVVPKPKPNEGNSKSDQGKSKAELRAERRAKQEAQRAAKQAAVDQKAAPVKEEAAKSTAKTVKAVVDEGKEKSPKPKADKGAKAAASAPRAHWCQLYDEHDHETPQNVPLNSNLHPAIIKLGVQFSSRVITGSNARCIAFLDALKKMIRDFSLPARTEFARALEPALTASTEYLWSRRPPSAAHLAALQHLRHRLALLPNHVHEFDAKKTLQEEIDHYIEDQIDKAGEAISMTVQKKISNGDTILTYGCSSLIERCLREAWQAGLRFRPVVVGDRVTGAGREMLRRLTAAGLPCTYYDITSIYYIMKTVNKVLLGASALLVNGSVVGAAGTAAVALCARDHNAPVLVVCETHKVSERVRTDAFVHNELGDPEDLIDKSDPNNPLKDWRSIPNLTLLNLTYDVTPPSLVTAVVTEKAILPCTSAPVVLRTKLSEYGM